MGYFLSAEGIGGFLAKFSRSGSEERDPDFDALEDLQRAMDSYDADAVSVQAGIPSELDTIGKSYSDVKFINHRAFVECHHSSYLFGSA